MDGNYNDSQQPVNVGLVSPWTTFFHARKEVLQVSTTTKYEILCHDVLIEPALQQLTCESLPERTANVTDKARVDIAARGFWISSQLAFFDIKAFNPIARRHGSQELKKAYEINKRENKIKDNIMSKS